MSWENQASARRDELLKSSRRCINPTTRERTLRLFYSAGEKETGCPLGGVLCGGERSSPLEQTGECSSPGSGSGEVQAVSAQSGAGVAYGVSRPLSLPLLPPLHSDWPHPH